MTTVPTIVRPRERSSDRGARLAARRPRSELLVPVVALLLEACRPAEGPRLDAEEGPSARRFAEPGSAYASSPRAAEGGAPASPDGPRDPGPATGGAPESAAAGRPAFESCAPAEPPPAACGVSGSGPALLVKGDLILPWGIVEQGGVRVDASGRIECFGCDCPEHDARVVRCPNAVVAPGLLNLHDHIGYAGTPPLGDTGVRYEHRHEWRLGLDGHTALEYEGRASAAEVVAHELRMVMSGVTAGVTAGGRAGLLRNLDSDEQSGLGYAGIVAETFPLADSSGAVPSSPCGFSSRHDDAESVAGVRAYVPHLGEGIDELARTEVGCAASAAFGLLSGATAVVHAVGVTAVEAGLLAESRAHVVWSPRSNVALYGNTAPIPLLRRLGVPIALGTDWLASGSMNLQRELACARELVLTRFDGALDARALVDMVTYDAALAVGLESALGSLQVGRFGDLALFVRDPAQQAADAVIGADPADVLLVLRAGQPLYGETELVAALLAPDAAGCEELDVCGAPRSACVERETGLTLAAVRAAGEAVYPLASCTPDSGEPSCVPRRPGEYEGIRDGDRDGDGVDDGLDVCPATFDPIRPLDAGAQADADGDGQGDACDPCPFEPDDACPPVAPLDLDRDGIANALDVCPRSADPEQLDGDGDGHGDACDPCLDANPGSIPCVLPIVALRDPSDPQRPPAGSAVVVEGVVSALRPEDRGFFMQDAPLPYAGIGVYSSAALPGVVLGARVRVAGFTHRYQDTDELLGPSLQGVVASGVELAPLVVADPASIADGGALASAYEGLLVTLGPIAVEATNADAPDDYDETLLAFGLRLDDALYPELDNGFAPGTLLAVTGILGRSYGHFKLWPRFAADVQVK